MQNVSTSTQQSTTTTHDATQQMERLARLAGQLLTSVEVFKLRDERLQQVKVTPVPEQQRQISSSGRGTPSLTAGLRADRGYGA